jgi:ELP3 family radical SAM enzyme/protein acetyltransferase
MDAYGQKGIDDEEEELMSSLNQQQMMKKQNDPNTYKHTAPEKFTINKDLEDIFVNWQDESSTSMQQQESTTTTTTDLEEIQSNQELQDEFLLGLLRYAPTNETELNSAMLKVRKSHKTNTKKSSLLRALNRLESKQDPRLDREKAARIRPILVKKAGKSQSGVLVVTVLTSPYPKTSDGKIQPFTCEFNCYYCPNEPGQPRSYLHDEPSVLRANRNEFDAVLQFFDRVATLTANGHPADKIELLILGGTWHSYPEQYRIEFMRDLFYAANSFAPSLEQAKKNMAQRGRGTIEEEKSINEITSGCKIIGITIETRPDCITTKTLPELRRLGVTRVQIGLQHTDDDILNKVNRAHTVDDAKKALRLLKDNCYKVDVHWMPNLPGASPEIDGKMFERALGDPDLSCDQWKIYPTEVTPWTVIEKWFREGLYVPYGEQELFELLVYWKSKVHPWIRLNRVVRDIPSQYILGGVNSPSMRTEIQNEMERRGLFCPCIRCREVGDTLPNLSEGDEKPHLIERRYTAQGGEEIFISIEARIEKRKRDDVLFGFCRLRFPALNQDLIFPELDGCALVRELHVYGQLAATPDATVTGERSSLTQHVGYGTMLMRRAEELSLRRGYTKLAVIAGVGSRGFYKKIGYVLSPGQGEMMIKDLTARPATIVPRTINDGDFSGILANIPRKARLILIAVAFVCCTWSMNRLLFRKL